MMIKMVHIVLILISLLATDVTLISARWQQAYLTGADCAQILKPCIIQAGKGVSSGMSISVAGSGGDQHEVRL